MQDCNVVRSEYHGVGGILTSNAGEELSRKALDLAIRKRNEGVPFQEIEHTLAK